MTILDIFSWVPEKELSLEHIEEIVRDLDNKIPHEGYSLEHLLPPNANGNVIAVTNELMEEGKEACYLLLDKRTIAAIGYRR